MIKQLIKFSLNHIPRPVLQRIAGWAVPVAGLFYEGRGAECPVCGAKYRKFLPFGYVQPRPNALCPKCLSLERHRLLLLYLTRDTDLLTAFPRTLHIAPEVCIMRHLKPHYKSHPGQYVTADLESPLADLHFDVQQIPLAAGSVDVVICNHIMEHVADDRRAMRELHRVLKPGGWGIVLSPVDRDYEQTYEDDSITDPEERTRIFGQYDHRRIYGADYTDRLREAGIDMVSDFRRCYAEPKGIKPAELDALRVLFKKICEDPEYLADMKKAGQPAEYMDGEAFAAYIAGQQAHAQEALSAAGLLKK